MAARPKDMNNSTRQTDNSKQKIILEMERDFLLEVLDCKKIVPSLLTKGVLDDVDEEYICGTEENKLPPREQNSRLLKIITRTLPDGFNALLETLEEKHCDQALLRLCQTLDRRRASSSDGMTQPMMRGPSSSTATAGFTMQPADASDLHVADDDYHPRRPHSLSDRVGNLEVRVDKLEQYESDQIDTNVQRNQGKLDQLTRELNETRDEVKRIESEKDKIEEMMKTFQAENEVLSQRLAKTSRMLGEKNQQIARLEEQIEMLEKENRKLRTLLDQLNQDVIEVRTESDQYRNELRQVKMAGEKNQKELKKVMTERDYVMSELRKVQTEREQDRVAITQLSGVVKDILQQQQLFGPRQNQTGNRGNIPCRRLHANMGTRSATDVTEMAIKGFSAAKNYKNYKTPNNANK
ncbi:hypothetical protein BaRGS_00014057 [Batillaria attramentaria]|uniref:CARD domain-containing protein n=1 Tax=Batillaria attramentaria TaxID=370345 RepID=A0ABD0L5H8_9CAEN